MICCNIRICSGGSFVMCPLPRWTAGLIHDYFFPFYEGHVLFLLVVCVGTCSVLLGYTQSLISRKLVLENSTWCWFHSNVCLPSLLILDNTLVWYLSSFLHIVCPYIWPWIHQPSTKMWLVYTCASIDLVCICMTSSLWVPIAGLVADWRK